MFFMPFNILGMWFRGLLSIAILAGGIYLLYRWYDDSHVVEQTPVPVATDKVRADDLPPGEVRRPALHHRHRTGPPHLPVRSRLEHADARTVRRTGLAGLGDLWTPGRARALDAHAQVGHKSALLARCGPNEGGQREAGEQEKPEAEGPASEAGRSCADCSRGR